MLATPTYRRHFSHQSNLPSPTPSHSNLHSTYSSSHLDRSAPTSTPSTLLTATPSSSASGLDSISQLTSCLPTRGDLQYMASYPVNPAIRIQQSTPVPRSQAGEPSNPSWTLSEGDGSFDVAFNHSGYLRTDSNAHATSSSMNSPASVASSYYNQAPYTVGQSLNTPPLSGKLESYSPAVADQSTRAFSNNLPTPTHTPTQDSFRGRRYTGYNPHSRTLDHTMAASMAMKQELESHHLGADDEIPGLNHSARHSVSSFGNSPSTPLTAHDDLDDGTFKMPPAGETLNKVESWIDAYLIFPDDTDPMRSDMFSSSANMMSSSPAPQRSQGYLSPFGHGHPQVSDFLQKANQNRSQSPNVSQRPVSPFRQTSTWFEDSTKGIGNAQMRQQKMEADALRQAQRVPDQNQAPKTISPKDVELEYHDTEESKMPLFPDTDQYTQSTYGGNQYGAAASQYGWMANQPTVSAAPTSFTFTSTTPAHLQGIQFPPQSYRTASGLVGTEPIPDFPAHLTSMDSSASEAGPESTQTSARSVPEDVPRPTSTLADSGTYSCTYHGCSQRFDSPQKLQKHKREGHRQHPASHPNSSPAIGSNMSSAALLARNSQAGPHKCDRINPTTGKPCNAIFSRPYDLTRHEDTIHNGRKQKVRCALCVEEKTFSRNDALTRHMRVVHPEVDFPGKHRRRGE